MPDRPVRRRDRRPWVSRPEERRRALLGEHRVDTGIVQLVADGSGYLVLHNGMESSYVHDDPTQLAWEYTRWIGDVLDVVAPAGTPLAVAHLGGAGCSLARYVSATRPGSRQVVFEVDAGLVELACAAFDLRRDRRLRLRVADARAGLATLATGSQDVVIRDAYADGLVPAHLLTVEFLAEVRRVLRPAGTYIANVVDRSDLGGARAETATALPVFADVALVGEPAQFRGRRFGNVLVVGSGVPLPTAALARRLASSPVRARLVPRDRAVELAAGYRPMRDPAAPAAPAGEAALSWPDEAATTDVRPATPSNPPASRA